MGRVGGRGNCPASLRITGEEKVQLKAVERTALRYAFSRRTAAGCVRIATVWCSVGCAVLADHRAARTPAAVPFIARGRARARTIPPAYDPVDRVPTPIHEDGGSRRYAVRVAWPEVGRSSPAVCGRSGRVRATHLGVGCGDA